MKLVAWVCVMVFGASAFAGSPPPGSAAAIDQRFRAEIASASADAAIAWDRGNAARDHDLAAAAAAYREAIALAPKVDHPHRRLCGTLDLQHQADEAIRECELALSLAPSSSYDKSTLAKALFGRGRGDDKKRGAALAHEAAQALPDDPNVVGIDCLALVMERDESGVMRCTDHWVELAPHEAGANLFAANVALARNQPARARAFLETAGCRSRRTTR